MFHFSIMCVILILISSHNWVATYLWKSCWLCMSNVLSVSWENWMYLLLSQLVLRIGFGFCLYQFLSILLYNWYSASVGVRNRIYFKTQSVVTSNAWDIPVRDKGRNTERLQISYKRMSSITEIHTKNIKHLIFHIIFVKRRQLPAFINTSKVSKDN